MGMALIFSCLVCAVFLTFQVVLLFVYVSSGGILSYIGLQNENY